MHAFFTSCTRTRSPATSCVHSPLALRVRTRRRRRRGERPLPRSPLFFRPFLPSVPPPFLPSPLSLLSYAVSPDIILSLTPPFAVGHRDLRDALRQRGPPPRGVPRGGAESVLSEGGSGSLTSVGLVCGGWVGFVGGGTGSGSGSCWRHNMKGRLGEPQYRIDALRVSPAGAERR
jgi:hypothetical protein